MKGLLPAELLNRSKHGFEAPVSGWLKSILKGMCEDIIHNDHLIGELFQKYQLKDMFVEHNKGVYDHGRLFWKIIMLHFWSEQF